LTGPGVYGWQVRARRDAELVRAIRAFKGLAAAAADRVRP
jgi:hypothetical protein